jgi:hypothetical protein
MQLGYHPGKRLPSRKSAAHDVFSGVPKKTAAGQRSKAAPVRRATKSE